jgi:hypothetical protein
VDSEEDKEAFHFHRDGAAAAATALEHRLHRFDRQTRQTRQSMLGVINFEGVCRAF